MFYEFSEYESLAIKLLDKFNKIDKDKTHLFLHKTINQFRYKNDDKDVTCVSIAVSGELKKFVCNLATQNSFDKIWYGQMSQPKVFKI
jgi:hypothetical protein